MVGLGNPTPKYEGSRHNVGFEVLKLLRQWWLLPAPRQGFHGRYDDARLLAFAGQPRVVLLEPHTYMNLSGRAVREMLDFHKAPPGDLLVVLDDMALPPGRIRARAGGSAGGHNGLADVLRALGTQEVPRLRIGIGAAPPRMDAMDFVLSRFRNDEIETIQDAVLRAARAVEDWIKHDLNFVMERYNRKPED